MYFFVINKYCVICKLQALHLFAPISFSGITNSFPEFNERKKFIQKYYQILLHGRFPMKEPKLLLEGPSDSGKTSWVEPFKGNFISKNIVLILSNQNSAEEEFKVTLKFVFR